MMKPALHRWSISFTLILFLRTVVFAQGTIITVLHVNDTHSHLDATGPKDANLNGTLGGIAKAATVIRSVRNVEPNVLLLHAGDLFQGDLFFNKYLGVPELELMKQLGFDAMVVGNHEFDLGPGVLYKTLSQAFAHSSFPILSANLDMSAYTDLTKWIKPSVVKTVGGVRIGIFGMSVPDDPTTRPAPVVILSDIVPIAEKAVVELRKGGANVVICLSHLGTRYDRMIAEKVSGIDFIVGGHDHLLLRRPLSVKNPDGRKTQIVQAGKHYRYIGKLRFKVEKGSVHLLEYRILPVTAAVEPEAYADSVVNSLKRSIIQDYGDVYGSVLGWASTDLEKRHDRKTSTRDTPMGNLISDAYRNKTGTDLALTANGLISEKIWAGPIVGADVFRAVSYGFDDSTRLGYRLATFEILGSELIRGLGRGVSNVEIEDNYLIQVSGMSYKYDPRKSVGQRVIVESIRINGRPIVRDRKYTVTVNEGIVGMLNAVGMNVENIKVVPDFEYLVLRDYIAKLRTVDRSSLGRIREWKADRPPN